MNILTDFAAFFKGGGPAMYLILANLVIIVAIVVERLIVIGRAAGISGKRMADDLAQRVARGDIAGARRIAADSNTPVAKVALAVLDSAGDEASVRTAAEDSAALVMPAMTRSLAHLNMLANVATLLGLLGTIFGLTTAFAAVGAAEPAQRSAFLAAGIAEALNATAFGLIVAVPTLVVHGFLVGLVEGVADQVDEMGIRLGQAMTRAASGHAPAAVHPIQGARPAVQGYVAITGTPRAAGPFDAGR